MKKVCLVILCVCFSVQMFSQNQSYVYMEDDNFYIGCEDYYMWGVNYSIGAIQAANDTMYISPTFDQCGPSGCPDGPPWRSCGINPEEWKQEIKNHFFKMDTVLGFNTVRILQLLEVAYDSTNMGEMIHVPKYHTQQFNDSSCYAIANIQELTDSVIERQGDLLQQVVDIIYENNLNLKLLPLMGGHGVELLPDKYADYLAYIADRFKNEPVIIGYDLYNEPINFKGDPDMNTYQVSEICLDWYNTIKRNASSHLVTIGYKLYDLYKWDPEILPVDFASFHPYALINEKDSFAYQPAMDRYKARLKYMSRNFSVPYLIGESGYSATDRFRDSCDVDFVHPRVGDTTDQKNFAIESIKYTKWYGHKGYTWWKYKDTPWFECDSSKAYKGLYGIVYIDELIDPGIPEEHKPYGDIIINYESYQDCSNCSDPAPEIYNNPTFTDQTSTLMYGSVLNPTYNNSGLEDVFIWASIEEIVNVDTTWESSFAITDSLGRFQIKTSFLLSDIHYVYIKYSKPGWAKKNIEYNSDSIPTDSVTYYLEPLNPDSIAQKPIYQSWTITSGMDTTWYNPQVPASNDIIVKDGATLSIKTSVYFNSGARLIVERGGTLIIDANGKLTSNCSNGLWEGVEVWGNADLNQASNQQGVVMVINGGTIENARIGITAIKTINGQGSFGLPNFSFTGGIIIAEKAVFKNNTTAVKFYDYDFVSKSDFNDCDFIIDNDYMGSNDPDYFVKLLNMNRVDFQYCRFKNNSSNKCYGSGIYSLNTAFKVEGKCLGSSSPCTSWAYGEFENLKYAIYATSGGTVYFPEISHTEFTDNYRGVYLSAVEKASVKYCNIRTGPMCAGASYGLYLDASTGYTIEENYFDMGYTDGIGIVVNNSGPAPNIINNNQFNDLKFGIFAQKENRAKDGTGLVFKCNQYTDVQYDELVLWKDPYISNRAGIATSQGYFDQAGPQPEHMAGNLFHIPPGPVNGDNDDMYNEANDFTYYYPSNVDENYDNVKPEDFTELTINDIAVNITTVEEWTYENGCPPTEEPGGGGSGKEVMKSSLAETQLKIDSTENLLSLLIDGGDTEELQTDVDNSIPPGTYDVYNELMQNSPYLSDTVVSTAIEKEDVLLNTMIRDIMVANPHTAKSSELMAKLDERWDPLPEYMKAQILQGKSIVSIREETESALTAYKQEKVKVFNNLVRYYLNDTINNGTSIDSLNILLNNEHNLAAKYTLAFLHLNNGKLQEGLNAINAIPSQFQLDNQQTAEYQQLELFFNLVHDIILEDKTVLEIDSTQQLTLANLEATGKGIAGVYARNILLALEVIEYDEPILFPDMSKSTEAMEEYLNLMNTKPPKLLNVKPNPANDYIIIEYSIERVENSVIEIVDINGKPVTSYRIIQEKNQNVIITRGWKPGIYLATIKTNGKILESVKFTVIK